MWTFLSSLIFCRSGTWKICPEAVVDEYIPYFFCTFNFSDANSPELHQFFDETNFKKIHFWFKYSTNRPQIPLGSFSNQPTTTTSMLKNLSQIKIKIVAHNAKSTMSLRCAILSTGVNYTRTISDHFLFDKQMRSFLFLCVNPSIFIL